MLYASRRYTVLRARVGGNRCVWTEVGHYRPEVWRRISSGFRLTSRLGRDGFHALAAHPSGNLVGAVPGAIVTLRAGNTEFLPTHRVMRGTRPLHITCTPDGRLYWGEYFDNRDRDEVHIFASDDGGLSW